MKLKALGLAAAAVTALMAFAASSASATTLEAFGTTQNGSVNIEASLASGTSMTWTRTDGTPANTCKVATMKVSTVSPFTGATVTGPVASWAFNSCTRPVVPHIAGTFHVSHNSGTTNGTVTSSGTEVTVGSPFGTLNCKTGSGVDFGTLTGVAGGHATIDVNAVINCGFLVPSAKWAGTYTITSETGIGVSA